VSLQFRHINGYRVPGNFLNIRVAIALLAGELFAGIVGFMYLESYTFEEAWYMTIITISTVGYTEVRPLTSSGEIFATFLILANIGIFAYLLSTFSYYVIQGEFFKKWHLRLIGKEIDKLKGHVVICGYGRYGKEVVGHFMLRSMPFVVIENDPEMIQEIQNSNNRILYIEGDATNDDVLLEAGIKHARSMITALPADADNVLITISAKQLNPQIDVISRASDLRAEPKLKRAGANHVVLPEQIGGFFMATLVSKPGAIEFLSYITNEKDTVDIAFEEIKFADLPDACKNVAIGELKIGESTGMHIIGFVGKEGNFIVNPTKEQRVVEGSSLITLGSGEQLKRLRTYLAGF